MFNFEFPKRSIPVGSVGFTSIAAVWAAIDAGLTVHWASAAYALTVEPCDPAWYLANGYPLPEAYRNGQCLRVTCTENYFGSFLQASELGSLYTFPR